MEMIFVQDKTLKYKYVYDPSNELASDSGKLYEHTYIMCQHIGRKLTTNEVVHHIDRDRSNNKLENLLLLTKEEHGLLHWLEREYLPQGSIKSKQDLERYKHLAYETRKCLHCTTNFKVSKFSDRNYCSKSCGYFAKRKFDLSKESLEYLVWKYPTTEVAKRLGVSDVAITKRCKKLRILKPSRGYWAKKKAGKL